MCEGIAGELLGIDLGDKRLNRRSVNVLEALAADPQASVNGACAGWADTLAAYRLFNHESVTPERILEPHRWQTSRRIAEHPVVLIVQDTTELDFSDHPPRDARCLDHENRFGMYQHLQLAITPQRLPLGVVGSECFDRAPESLGQTKQRSSLPIEEKESFRWLEGYRQACELARECPGTRIVSVADREADLYDIFVEAQQQQEQDGPHADFLIRAKVDRRTLERDPDAGAAAYRKVRDEVHRSKLLATRVVELGTTPKRAARQATLAVRALRVTVKPPHARSHLPPVTIHVVLAEELDAPGDGSDVSWLLLTTLPIDTLEEVLQTLDFYVARWTIELYFRTLKTGCRVEEMQLETKSRLQNCLAFYNIIAWRILYLTYLNRTSPTLPCTAIFEPAEWKSVWCVVQKRPLPRTPPTLAEFLKLLTHLGGYNNRATEHAPGPQPLWIGLRRMLDFATAWLNFGPDRNETCV